MIRNGENSDSAQFSPLHTMFFYPILQTNFVTCVTFFSHLVLFPIWTTSKCCHLVMSGLFRVQRFPEKALFLQNECLPKGNHPALISTCTFSNQFKLKESQKRDFFPPISVDH